MSGECGWDWRERGRWGGLDLSGLFARHRKPAGMRIKILITLFMFIMFRCSSLVVSSFLDIEVQKQDQSRTLGSGERAGFLVLSGLGRARDRLFFLDGVERGHVRLGLGDAGLVFFTRRTPHWKPTRARTYATTFFPFPCFVMHSCKVVPHFCDNDVCRRKVLESFEATYV